MRQARPHPLPHNVSFELSENRKLSGHRTARRRGQIQRPRHRNKTYLKRRQFLQRLHQIRDRPADPLCRAQHNGSILERTEGLQTPPGGPTMARRKSNAELQAELDSANGYIDALEATLDDIAGIATKDEDEDSDEDDDDEDCDEDCADGEYHDAMA